MKEYKSGTTFPGVIGRTEDQSEPAWPEPLQAKEGAPNVLFIVLDDTGFGQLGCYGAALSTHSIWIAWLLMVFLTAICILLPYAHLAAHACLPAETIIRTTWPASPKAQRVIQAIMAIDLLRTAFCQRCFCSMVTTPMLSANGI